jgi:hypothetical protein
MPEDSTSFEFLSAHSLPIHPSALGRSMTQLAGRMPVKSLN